MRFPHIRSRLVQLACICIGLTAASLARAQEKPDIAWQPWSNALFRQASAQHKLVILDLKAGWCHWCHVMDVTTYSDPHVAALMAKGYIATRVDQDERPDLSTRYEDYGWPATIIFKWDGTELAKRAGYIPPREMAAILQAFIDDPTPGPSISNTAPIVPAADAALSADQRKAMRDTFISAYDPKLGGWGRGEKSLDWNALEYALSQAAAGDTQMATMARTTMTNGLKLIDPVWGGVDQYSIDDDWNHPHFEKIMPFQAENMRVFAVASSLWRDPKWPAAAQQIHNYLAHFLTSPDGAFYTSQDADLIPGQYADKYFALDDTARRSLGVPRIDKHIFAADNGLAITGLTALYSASGDTSALDQARRAATWIIANRSLPHGGFRHDGKDAGGPYLDDTLQMGRAFLALYAATADRTWLTRAKSAADFIHANFQTALGYATSAASTAGLTPQPEADENVTLVRFANLLGNYTGRPADRSIADHAMRYLASPEVIKEQGYSVSGILLAADEMRTAPLHIVIVGSKKDSAAVALYSLARQDSPPFTRLEWYDRTEGPLPHADIQYPALKIPAAFLCTATTCSAPLSSVPALQQKLDGLKH